MSRVAAVACGLFAFAPWATVNVQILGVWSPGHHVSGTDLGSGVISGIGAGWIVIVLAAAALAASSSDRVGRRRVAALLLLGYVIYIALTLSHHTLGVTAGGHDISSLIGARVSLAWGAIGELVAAGALTLAALLASPTADEYVLA